jgi:hypothetical protein
LYVPDWSWWFRWWFVQPADFHFVTWFPPPWLTFDYSHSPVANVCLTNLKKLGLVSFGRMPISQEETGSGRSRRNMACMPKWFDAKLDVLFVNGSTDRASGATAIGYVLGVCSASDSAPTKSITGRGDKLCVLCQLFTLPLVALFRRDPILLLVAFYSTSAEIWHDKQWESHRKTHSIER